MASVQRRESANRFQGPLCVLEQIPSIKRVDDQDVTAASNNLKDCCVHKGTFVKQTGRYKDPSSDEANNLQGPFGVVKDSPMPEQRPTYNQLGARGPEIPSGKMHAAVPDSMVGPGLSIVEEVSHGVLQYNDVASTRSRRKRGGDNTYRIGMQGAAPTAPPKENRLAASSQMHDALTGVPPPKVPGRRVIPTQDSSQLVNLIQEGKPLVSASASAASRGRGVAHQSDGGNQSQMYEVLAHSAAEQSSSARYEIHDAKSSIAQKSIRTYEQSHLDINHKIGYETDSSQRDTKSLGIRTFQPGPFSSDIDRVVQGKDIDGSERNGRPLREFKHRGVRTYEQQHLDSEVQTGHDIDRGDSQSTRLGIRTFQPGPHTSDVDKIVYGHDNGEPQSSRLGIRTFEPGPHASDVDSTVFGHDIDFSEAHRAHQDLKIKAQGPRTYEGGPLSSDVDRVVLGHDIDGSENRGRIVHDFVEVGRRPVAGHAYASPEQSVVRVTAVGSATARQIIGMPKAPVSRATVADTSSARGRTMSKAAIVGTQGPVAGIGTKATTIVSARLPIQRSTEPRLLNPIAAPYSESQGARLTDLRLLKPITV